MLVNHLSNFLQIEKYFLAFTGLQTSKFVRRITKVTIKRLTKIAFLKQLKISARLLWIGWFLHTDKTKSSTAPS